MGLIILANLPNDINWVHDLLKYDEGFAVLGKSLCKIFSAVTDLAPRNLQSKIAHLCTVREAVLEVADHGEADLDVSSKQGGPRWQRQGALDV